MNAVLTRRLTAERLIQAAGTHASADRAFAQARFAIVLPNDELVAIKGHRIAILAR